MKSSQRGLALGNILMLSMVLFALLTISSGTWIVQMNLSGKGSAREGARRLAEATAQCAVARVLKDPDLNPLTLPRLSVTLPAYPQGEGWLAFREQAATDLNIPLSVNNLKGSVNVPGWGTTVVAPAQANLVAVGRYRGAEWRTEVILHVPPFPYVVASTVPVKSRDGLTVFGIRSPAALSGGFAAIPADQRVPGHLMTNAADLGSGDAALQLLGRNTHIQGDAKAFGNVWVDPSAQVDGEVRPFAQRVQLPVIDVASLDTASRPGCSTLLPGTAGATQLSGFQRCAGDLNFTNGLELRGGVLFVQGALTITGGLKGKGAILATGPVRVTGGGALEGDNQTAILARGSVSLQGTALQSSEFRGLVYTEGNLDCRYANIAGSVVVNNPDPGGIATLEQVALVESRPLATLSIPVTISVPGSMLPEPFFAYHSGAAGSNAFGLSPIQAQDRDGNPHDIMANANLNWHRMDYDNPPAGFPVTHPKTTAEPWIEIGVPDPMPADPLTLGVIRAVNMDPNPGIVVHSDDGSWWQQDHLEDYTSYDQARAGVGRMVQDWGGDPGQVDAWLAEAQQRVRSQVQEYVNAYNSNSLLRATQVGGTGGGTLTTQWRLDMSQFYSLSERIRVLSWRPLP